MENNNQVIVYVHGIGQHTAGFSDEWYQALRPHLSDDLPTSEVVWSDIVNPMVRSIMSATMDDHSGMRQMKTAINDIMFDRMTQIAPQQTAASNQPMSARQARSLVSNPIDDFLFYMFNSFIRNQVLGRFERVMEKHLAEGKAVQLIAHSWGSVVAYEGLRRLEPSQLPGRVANFFSVGSALSISPVVSNLFGRVDTGRKSHLNDRWINLDAQWDVVGGRIGASFEVDREHLNLTPVGCDSFFGVVNPTCAHASYFHEDNDEVNKSIFSDSLVS